MSNGRYNCRQDMPNVIRNALHFQLTRIFGLAREAILHDLEIKFLTVINKKPTTILVLNFCISINTKGYNLFSVLNIVANRFILRLPN